MKDDIIVHEAEGRVENKVKAAEGWGQANAYVDGSQFIFRQQM